jgi:hypothetical protein
LSFAHFFQKKAILVDGSVDALEIQIFSSRSRIIEIYDLLMSQNGVGGRTTAGHEHDQKNYSYAHGKLAPTIRVGAFRHGVVQHGSNPTENQENDYDQEDHTDSSGRGVTPIPTVRPPGQRPEEC